MLVGVVEIASCGDLTSCEVRRDLYVLVATIVAYMVTFLVALQYLSLLSQSVFLVAFAFLALLAMAMGLVHEVAHYAVAKYVFGRPTRIGFILPYGALVIEYDEVLWGEWMCIAFAPQIAVTLPLALVYAVSGDLIAYALLVLHIVASAPDIVNMVRTATVFRGCRFRLCKKGKRVVGYAVIRPDGSCTLYKI